MFLEIQFPVTVWCEEVNDLRAYCNHKLVSLRVVTLKGLYVLFLVEEELDFRVVRVVILGSSVMM